MFDTLLTMIPGTRNMALPPAPSQPGWYQFANGGFRRIGRPATSPAAAQATATSAAAPAAAAPAKLSQQQLAEARAAFTQVCREERERLAGQQAAAETKKTGFAGRLRFKRGMNVLGRKTKATSGRAK